MTPCRIRYGKNMKNRDLFWNNEETGSGRLADGYAGRLSGKTENAFFAFAAEGAFFGV